MKCVAFILISFLALHVQSQEKISRDFEVLLQLYQEMNFDSIIKIEDAALLRSNEGKKGAILELYAASYEALNQDDKALDYLKRAKKEYHRHFYFEKVAKVNAKIWHLLNSQKNLDVDQELYLNELKAYAQQVNSQKWMMTYYNIKGIENFNAKAKDSSKIYFKKALRMAEDIDSLQSICNLNINLGALNLVEYKLPDSAIYYYNQALERYQLADEEDVDLLFALYNNLGNAFREQKKYKEALSYYQLAETLDLKLHNKMSKRILYSNMDVTYYYMDDWKNAYLYLYKYDSVNQLLEIKQQNTNITNIEEKYNNEKLRADNLEIEAKRVQNRNLSYALGGSLFLGSIILLLVFKNRNKKQVLAEQQQQLKSQQLANQLKELELKAIDAMIEGQEKERQRIANDLHDDLGGLMATVKLHFTAFQQKNTPELYTKTNQLIDEAYQKIRSIAHAKNAGVIAKQGLLKAVQHMAEKIVSANQLNIKVLDHGLDERLENSLELTLFRIIQELLTNIIKHAEATEACIHLTHHEDSFNIMVEDNGKGFNPNQITKTNAGMGISSIDKRVEHLGGKLTIESEKNKGTTVIIDIPL